MISVNTLLLALVSASLVAAAPIEFRRADAANFGSCSTPEIIFAAGLDNRKETAFEPKDLKSFNHGSAQNIAVITQAVCDGLTNSCKANQAAKDLCTKATAAANGGAAKTGVQADLFNAVFGIKSNFAAVQVIDDTGKAVGAPAAAAAAAPAAAAAAPPAAAAAAPPAAAAAASGAASFGSCSIPQITFAVGLDNRKETSFEPTDLKSFNHGSAQNIDIITKFMCDQLTNSCKANQAAKDLCTKAEAAADTGAAKTGVQADLFNAVFGVKTNFAAVQAIDDQGRAVGAAAAAAAPAAAAAAPAADLAASAPAAAAGAADFGSCTAPQLVFAVGLDNRKETAFEPKDLKSFNHGSAQNPDIITQFMCDTLTNSCKANQAAKDLCTKAKAAADTGAAKTGVQADLFNAVFGVKTNFAAVQAIDDQGRPVGAAAAAAAPAAASAAAPAAAAAAPAAAAASSGAASFGSCSTPAITFAVGLDNRKETSFEPTDLKSFNHGSAQNIDIITKFMCDQLTNSCKANQAAKDLCTKAQAAADTGKAKTGVQADLFNAVFGVKTNFAAVQAIDDQGRAVAA